MYLKETGSEPSDLPLLRRSLIQRFSTTNSSTHVQRCRHTARLRTKWSEKLQQIRSSSPTQALEGLPLVQGSNMHRGAIAFGPGRYGASQRWFTWPQIHTGIMNYRSVSRYSPARETRIAAVCSGRAYLQVRVS